MGGDSQASNFIYFLNVFHSASKDSFWRRHIWFDLVFAISLIVMVSAHPPGGQCLVSVPRQAEARAVAAATTRGHLLGSQLVPQQLHQPVPGCPRQQHGLQGGLLPALCTPGQHPVLPSSKGSCCTSPSLAPVLGARSVPAPLGARGPSSLMLRGRKFQSCSTRRQLDGSPASWQASCEAIMSSPSGGSIPAADTTSHRAVTPNPAELHRQRVAVLGPAAAR